MADLADQAQEETELDLNVALSNRPERMPETGVCYGPDCEIIIGVGNFCGRDCRDSYEIEQKIMKG